MVKFTIEDLFSIAPKYNYINDSYHRNIATFHHSVNQKIMTVEQMIMGIHITIIEKKSGDIIRAEHAHSAVNAILIMEA